MFSVADADSVVEVEVVVVETAAEEVAIEVEAVDVANVVALVVHSDLDFTSK